MKKRKVNQSNSKNKFFDKKLAFFIAVIALTAVAIVAVNFNKTTSEEEVVSLAPVLGTTVDDFCAQVAGYSLPDFVPYSYSFGIEDEELIGCYSYVKNYATSHDDAINHKWNVKGLMGDCKRYVCALSKLSKKTCGSGTCENTLSKKCVRNMDVSDLHSQWCDGQPDEIDSITINTAEEARQASINFNNELIALRPGTFDRVLLSGEIKENEYQLLATDDSAIMWESNQVKGCPCPYYNKKYRFKTPAGIGNGPSYYARFKVYNDCTMKIDLIEPNYENFDNEWLRSNGVTTTGLEYNYRFYDIGGPSTPATKEELGTLVYSQFYMSPYFNGKRSVAERNIYSKKETSSYSSICDSSRPINSGILTNMNAFFDTKDDVLANYAYMKDFMGTYASNSLDFNIVNERTNWIDTVLFTHDA